MGRPGLFVDPVSAINFQSPTGEGLIAAYVPLPGQPGWNCGLTLRDVAGKADATLGGTGTPAFVPTESLGGWDFAGGSSQRYALPAWSRFNFGQDSFCLSAWIRPTSVGTYQAILGKDVSGSRAWVFGIGANALGNPSSGNLGFFGGFGIAPTVLAGSGTVIAGQWQHVAAMRRGDQFTVWRNGVQLASATNSARNYTEANAINIGGRELSGGNQHFTGLIGEIFIHRGVVAPDLPRLLYQQACLGYPEMLRWVRPTAWFVPDTPPGGITGSLNVTLPAPTLEATGTIGVSGTLSQTLPAPTLASTGTVAVQGALAQTLPAPTLSATGTVAISGTASATLPAPALSSTGAVLVQGTLSQTLPAPTLVATGVVTSGITGSLTATLPTPTLSATGTVAVAGVLAQTLPAPTLLATGAVQVSGSLTATLPAPTLLATGVVATPGEFNAAYYRRYVLSRRG